MLTSWGMNLADDIGSWIRFLRVRRHETRWRHDTFSRAATEKGMAVGATVASQSSFACCCTQPEQVATYATVQHGLPHRLLLSQKLAR